MKISELIRDLNEALKVFGDLEVTNSMDAVITSVMTEEGVTEEYLILDDNGYDIEDVQQGVYE